MTQIKETKIGNSYWDGNGAYQNEFNDICTNEVPDYGNAKTLNPELVRAIQKLNYEFFNNGNCNALDITEESSTSICPDCEGSGYQYDKEEREVEICGTCYGEGSEQYNEYKNIKIKPFYLEFLGLIRTIDGIDEYLLKLEWVLTSQEDYSYSDDEIASYTRVFDRVMHYVLNNEDKELPKSYKNKD